MDAIAVSGLGKRFTLGAAVRHNTLRDVIADTIAWRRRAARMAGARREFWALRGVDFSIRQGTAVGIIGPNGAGKSTLLKILSRIVEPTEGEVRIRGRVGSLLEVGTGFHSELTGRENTYLSGAVLGMRRADIERQFDAIIAFAGLDGFVDTPVKHYSSGMYLRLAFAVAAHLEPDVLLVDEVLAVGDAEFQKKCLGRMEDVTHREGRTVCFVSHNLQAVERLCSQCLLLDRGRLAGIGTTAEMIAMYQQMSSSINAPGEWIDVATLPRTGSGLARFTRLVFTGASGAAARTDGPLLVTLEIEASEAFESHSLALCLFDVSGTLLVNADIRAIGSTCVLRRGTNRIEIRIEALRLKPGTYRLGLWMTDRMLRVVDYVQSAMDLEVHSDERAPDRPPVGGLVACDFTFTGP